MPPSRDAVVLLREDIPGDQRLVAYVTGTAPGPIASADLRAHLKRTLPDHLVPSVVVTLDEWPLTPNGKIDRRALPAPGESVPVPESAGVAPSTATEERLAGIWRDLLHVATIGVHDNFFDLGGHSLLAARAAMRVRDAFEVEATLAMFFETPTIAGMAAAIDAAGASRLPLVIARAPRVWASKDQLVRP